MEVQHKYKLLLHNLSTCNACIDIKEACGSRTNLFLGDDILLDVVSSTPQTGLSHLFEELDMMSFFAA